MLRDFHRTQTLDPDARRAALHKLALALSQKGTPIASEELFLEIIDDDFRVELRRLTPEDRRLKREELFGDLRSSATLTRSEGSASGWMFSHNSLREYLVSESIVSDAIQKIDRDISVPVTSAIRSFIGSLKGDIKQNYLAAVQELWHRSSGLKSSRYLVYNWELLQKADGGLLEALRYVTRSGNGSLELERSTIEKVDINPSELTIGKVRLKSREMAMSETAIRDMDLSNSHFDYCILDRVSFKNCNLENCTFKGAYIFECEFTETCLNAADFRSVDADINFVVLRDGKNVTALSGKDALGYLNYYGAYTDDVTDYHIYQHHPKFSIVSKICTNISEQRNSQLRGLTQRGVAQPDPSFARELVNYLVNANLIEVDNKKKLVPSTSEGRKQLPLFVEKQILMDGLPQFLERYR